MEWLNILSKIQGSDVGFGIAFLAGVITFFSPCILPVIPGYIGYFTGVGVNEVLHAGASKKRFYKQAVFIHSLWFVFGFLIIFVLLGMATGAVGSFLAVNKIVLQRIGGGLLILLGVYLMQIIKIPWLYKETKFTMPHVFKKFKWLNSLAAGVTFGFAWTPCIGPILATILFLATFSGGSFQGFLLLFVFALGLGLPFIVVALGIQRFLPLIRRAGKYIALIQKLAGASILILGILLVLNLFNPVLSYFIRLSNPIL